jgi:hypothetical protein
MRIDPSTLDLFTDSGRFLKRLDCPQRVSWDLMTKGAPGGRVCNACSRMVHETSGMTDDDLVSLLEKDPSACLMISPTQENCTVIPRALSEMQD